MKEKVLLIGNGINNISQEYTWSDLIDNLIDFIGAAGQIETRDKPFPLLYEEIFVEAVKNRGFNEIQIKEFIGQEVSKLKSNELHKAFLNLKAKNILTTNYDFTFEENLTLESRKLKNNGIVKESLYSIFRHYQVGNKSIWHIHGDANYSNSITLGYEHYSGYLQQMRNYVVTGTGTSYKNIKLDSLAKRLKYGQLDDSHSWLDFFFTKDVHIIGLTLDFIEIHLWWLLTFRQRAKLTKEMNLTNKIVYYYPNSIAEKIQNKLQLLKSNDILAVSCRYNEEQKADYYKEIIKKINNGT